MSPHQNLTCWTEGIISERDDKGLPTEKNLVHYLIFYDKSLQDADGIAIYNKMIEELEAARDGMIRFHERANEILTK